MGFGNFVWGAAADRNLKLGMYVPLSTETSTNNNFCEFLEGRCKKGEKYTYVVMMSLSKKKMHQKRGKYFGLIAENVPKNYHFRKKFEIYEVRKNYPLNCLTLLLSIPT